MKKFFFHSLAALMACLMLWSALPLQAHAAGISFSGSGSLRAGTLERHAAGKTDHVCCAHPLAQLVCLRLFRCLSPRHPLQLVAPVGQAVQLRVLPLRHLQRRFLSLSPQSLPHPFIESRHFTVPPSV